MENSESDSGQEVERQVEGRVEEKEKEHLRAYFELPSSAGFFAVTLEIFCLFVLLLIVGWLFPEIYPIPFFSLLWVNSSAMDVLFLSFPIIAIKLFPIVLGILDPRVRRIYRKFRYMNMTHFKRAYANGFCVSAMAGFWEEIEHRWLLVFYYAVVLFALNFILFGFLGPGYGLVEFLHNWVFGPVANLISLGFLEQIIYGFGWLLGASVLFSNFIFGLKHAYQGLVGVIHAWIIGLYLFFVAFYYGLIAAIAVHFLYDFAINSTVAFAFWSIDREDAREIEKITRDLLGDLRALGAEEDKLKEMEESFKNIPPHKFFEGCPEEELSPKE